MSENQHGILDSGCHVFTLYNLCHYLRIVCVTISVDTFMSSHWSDLADRALSLAPEEVKFKQRLMISTTTQSTLTLKLVKLYTSQLRDTGIKYKRHGPYIMDSWSHLHLPLCKPFELLIRFQFQFRVLGAGVHALLLLWAAPSH